MTDTWKDQLLRALEPYKLKSEGAKKYRCNSPLRQGSDSHAFTVDFEKGVYCDHADGDRGGSLLDLAIKLGIDVPKREVENSKRAYTGLSDYAKSHGLDPQALIVAGWKEITYQNRPALEFTTKTGKRWRFLDGKAPHYKSENGYQRCWYYTLDSKILSRLIAGKPLVICNGEISTIAGRYYDLAAVSITAGEKGEIPSDLMAELAEFWADVPQELTPQVLIALDCDAAGRKAAKEMESQLKKAGYPACAVDLGLGWGGDLADFCKLYESQAHEMLVKLPPLADIPHTDYTERSWLILHASELENLPPVQWLLPDEIPEKGLCVLYGLSGAGKSFLSLDIALRLAQTVSVVYIAAEGESGYPQRIKAWSTHYQKGVGKLYICLGAVNIYDPDDFAAFVSAITGYQPRLVVVDTLAMCMSGDENDAKAMGAVIRACKRMMADLGCSVLMVHHVNKGGIAERGSTALRGACDVMIKVSPDDDIIRVECSKTKDTAPFPARYMKLLPITLGSDPSDPEKAITSPVIIPAEKIVQTKDDPLSPQQQKALRLLIMPDQVFGATVSDVANLTEMPQPSARRTLATLLRLEFVSRTESGKYQITEVGKQALLKNDHDPAIKAIIEDSDRSDRQISFVVPGNRHSDQAINAISAINEDSQANSSHSEKPADRSDRSDRLIADHQTSFVDSGNYNYNRGY